MDYRAGITIRGSALIERRYREMKNPAPCGAGFFTGIGFAADQFAFTR
jgi:hypothetical protein